MKKKTLSKISELNKGSVYYKAPIVEDIMTCLLFCLLHLNDVNEETAPSWWS